MSRPGVPTRTSQPARAAPRAAWCSRCRRTPPGSGDRREAPSRRASDSIWTTSSRVGAMISTRGAVGAGRRRRRRAQQRVKAAIRNAAVLPVPVCDWPATSLPLRASGSAASWIGVVVTKPASRIACEHGLGQVERGELHGSCPSFGEALAAAASGCRLPAAEDARADDPDLVEEASAGPPSTPG